MGKRRTEDYKQDHRIYTGLYTAKAFNILKDILPTVVMEYSSVVPIRDVNGETVLVTHSDSWERRGDHSWKSCREWMLDDIRSCFTRGLIRIPPDARENHFVLYLFLANGENSLDAEQKKILAKLRGVPRDVITSELNVCLAEEEAKIEAEYEAFAGALGRMDNFAAASSWFGQSWNLPKEMKADPPVQRPDFYPADMMDKLLKAEAECREVFNTFARTTDQYLKAQAKYRSILTEAKKLNTQIKNDRIKAVRHEFASAKRTSK